MGGWGWDGSQAICATICPNFTDTRPKSVDVSLDPSVKVDDKFKSRMSKSVINHSRLLRVSFGKEGSRWRMKVWVDKDKWLQGKEKAENKARKKQMNKGKGEAVEVTSPSLICCVTKKVSRVAATPRTFAIMFGVHLSFLSAPARTPSSSLAPRLAFATPC